MNPVNSFANLYRCKGRWSIITALTRQYASTSETIVVPKRIQRGPTDILRALESTIKRDYTAPEYKFHDDPYLIPTSNPTKRMYALSKESGRKAALWIRKEHAQWFNSKLAYPPIEALTAKPAITEASDASEDTLKNLIESSSVTDSITVYGILEKKGTIISDEVKQAFLELISFHNCDDSPSDQLIEERWFRQSMPGKQRRRKTWKDGGLAETVFKSLSSGAHSGNAHRALLRGMARHGEAERAWQMLRDMVASGNPDLEPDTGCYNSLISVVPFLKEGAEARWQLIESLLREMASKGLQPNLCTLNSILDVLSSMGIQRKAQEHALSTLAEFHYLGIEPSLASYYYILKIFCRERGPKSHVLMDIMDKLTGKDIEARDPKDFHFFVTAMDVCRNHLQDVELAHRVHDLLLMHNNYDFIGDSFKESLYYRNYFILMCAMEPLEYFMEVYNKLVPNVYVPEPAVMEEILKTIDLNGAVELLPQMWSDMIIFDQTRRESLLSSMLDIMARNPIIDTPSDSVETTNKANDMRASYMRIAWGIWEKMEEVEENNSLRSRNLIWTGSMLGDLMMVCVQCGEFEKAWRVLVRLGADDGRGKMNEDSQLPQLISGIPSVKSLLLFVDACIEQGDSNKGIACVKYASEAGYPEAGELGNKLAKGITLSQLQLDQLRSSVGIINVKDAKEIKDEVK